jgi:hypothetical protein
VTSMSGWKPNWRALADHAVNRTLRLQKGERVIYLVDPQLYPDLFDEFRAAVLGAGGIEQATIVAWTPRLAEFRTRSGHALDPDAALDERRAHMELFETADVFIWLPPTSYDRPAAYTAMESEWIVGRWPGRTVHFHWPLDPLAPRDHPVQRQIQEMGERAILELDYSTLADRQRRLLDALRGSSVRVTTSAGTDIRFDCPKDGWYYASDGDCSRQRTEHATSARDRTQELPCGVVRTIPAEDSVEGTIVLRKKPAFHGSGLDIGGFADDLDVVFTRGTITDLRSRTHQKALDAARGSLTGDWNRLGEFVIGMNPLLQTPPEAATPVYWGYGEGLVRFHFGENAESGGRFHTTTPLHTFLHEATVEANGRALLRDGKLLM